LAFPPLNQTISLEDTRTVSQVLW